MRPDELLHCMALYNISSNPEAGLHLLAALGLTCACRDLICVRPVGKWSSVRDILLRQLVPVLILLQHHGELPHLASAWMWTCTCVHTVCTHPVYRIIMHHFTVRANRRQTDPGGCTNSLTSWQCRAVGSCLLALMPGGGSGNHHAWYRHLMHIARSTSSDVYTCCLHLTYARNKTTKLVTRW